MCKGDTDTKSSKLFSSFTSLFLLILAVSHDNLHSLQTSDNMYSFILLIIFLEETTCRHCSIYSKYASTKVDNEYSRNDCSMKTWPKPIVVKGRNPIIFSDLDKPSKLQHILLRLP